MLAFDNLAKQAPTRVSTLSGPKGFLQTDLNQALRQAARVGGYAWWYIEMQDDNRQFGLTLILFAGSVFSPNYARALRLGQPICGLQVPAVNLVVCERHHTRWKQTLWVMSEYTERALLATDRSICVADTSLVLNPDGSLSVRLSERQTLFWGRPGRAVELALHLSPPGPLLPPQPLGQDDQGNSHFWQPWSLLSRASATLRQGATQVAFAGTAYCDHNFGGGRLENCFSRWGWAHACMADGELGAVVYDTLLKSGVRQGLAVRQKGRQSVPVVEQAAVPDAGDRDRGRGFFWLKVPWAISVGTLVAWRQKNSRRLDAPFYARFAATVRDETQWPGLALDGVGEYLELNRLLPLLPLLPYKTYCGGR